MLGGFDPSASQVAIKHGSVEYSRPMVLGVSANYATVQSVEIDAGRFFTDAEEQRRARVVVIPQASVARLFGAVDPIDGSWRSRGSPTASSAYERRAPAGCLAARARTIVSSTCPIERLPACTRSSRTSRSRCSRATIRWRATERSPTR
ncbi:MAG: ABC transporter permease [Blastocatellia bacterium]|nr:ABC transporter permease [Blastocatellia bacterium]